MGSKKHQCPYAYPHAGALDEGFYACILPRLHDGTDPPPESHRCGYGDGKMNKPHRWVKNRQREFNDAADGVFEFLDNRQRGDTCALCHLPRTRVCCPWGEYSRWQEIDP